MITTGSFPKALVGGKNDRKDRKGLPGKVGVGQKPVKAFAKQGRGR